MRNSSETYHLAGFLGLKTNKAGHVFKTGPQALHEVAEATAASREPPAYGERGLQRWHVFADVRTDAPAHCYGHANEESEDYDGIYEVITQESPC